MRAEPRLKPVNITVIISDRRRLGAYSDSSVVVLGIAAPIPMPASSRNSAICTGVEA